MLTQIYVAICRHYAIMSLDYVAVTLTSFTVIFVRDMC